MHVCITTLRVMYAYEFTVNNNLDYLHTFIIEHCHWTKTLLSNVVVGFAKLSNIENERNMWVTSGYIHTITFTTPGIQIVNPLNRICLNWNQRLVWKLQSCILEKGTYRVCERVACWFLQTIYTFIFSLWLHFFLTNAVCSDKHAQVYCTTCTPSSYKDKEVVCSHLLTHWSFISYTATLAGVQQVPHISYCFF